MEYQFNELNPGELKHILAVFQNKKLMENKDQPANPATIHKAKGDEVETVSFPGLSKREYFAGLALQGLINNVNSDKFIAESAVKLAEELLKQLEK